MTSVVADPATTCVECYYVLPPTGVRVMVETLDPVCPSLVPLQFCSQRCADTYAEVQGFLRG